MRSLVYLSAVALIVSGCESAREVAAGRAAVDRRRLTPGSVRI